MMKTVMVDIVIQSGVHLGVSGGGGGGGVSRVALALSPSPPIEFTLCPLIYS